MLTLNPTSPLMVKLASVFDREVKVCASVNVTVTVKHFGFSKNAVKHYIRVHNSPYYALRLVFS